MSNKILVGILVLLLVTVGVLSVVYVRANKVKVKSASPNISVVSWNPWEHVLKIKLPNKSERDIKIEPPKNSLIIPLAEIKGEKTEKILMSADTWYWREAFCPQDEVTFTFKDDKLSGDSLFAVDNLIFIKNLGPRTCRTAATEK